MLKVYAYQIADSIDIKQFKAVFTAPIYHADSDELFYRIEAEKLIYVFKYGVVCLLNHSEVEMTAFINLIGPYCKNLFSQRLSEEFAIETGATRNNFGYNLLELAAADVDRLRLVMLNVSQSVALDYYSQQTNLLLEETNYHTQMLERNGKLDLSGIHLKKFIGRTLNLKNRVAGNLYIFDSPDETWEDEELNKLDIGLKKTFDLQARFRTIQEGLEIVKENLDLFKDLLQYRTSVVLEWIVIALIFLEVINLVLDKLRHIL
ncbi:RMD1 family protein [Deminuibacter soli]|uniref:RMD1 family protein n=1 Tax=Deminuibacter soli TaxID=2291815 RepID=A0A3E1NJU5_9BACT|nr:RMD1 family protein [Deminuibacter soli]RFM28199.1 RMD1 family protein [Deminuibacter soli]